MARYVDSDSRLFLPVAAVPADSSGNIGVMSTGRKLVCLPVTPTLDTSIFAANDVLATAILTFAGAVRLAGGSGCIKKLTVIDASAQTATGELWLFDAAVTPAAANAAHSISDADAAHCLGVIPFGTYFSSALNSVSMSAGLTIPFTAAAGATSIYGILVTRGTPTYAANSLTVQLCIEQD